MEGENVAVVGVVVVVVAVVCNWVFVRSLGLPLQNEGWWASWRVKRQSNERRLLNDVDGLCLDDHRTLRERSKLS